MLFNISNFLSEPIHFSSFSSAAANSCCCLDHSPRPCSPQYILVGQKETCKVTNFGMARDVQQKNIYERKTKVIKNNRGGGSNSYRSVLWSFTIIVVVKLICS